VERERAWRHVLRRASARETMRQSRCSAELVDYGDGMWSPFFLSRSRVHRLLSPSRRNFPRARSLPWRFPLHAKSSPPGAKSYPPEAESSSSKVDLSSPHSLLHNFPFVITLALDKSDDSPVEERAGVAAVTPLGVKHAFTS
jgi:hypothetical protein